VHTILTLGNFDSPNEFFEKDYAERWSVHNYKTAFFDRITHIHTGKVTTENNGKICVKVVNLERRTDRKERMQTQLNNNGFEFIFFKAIDGNELLPTQELKFLFDGNNRKGVIGCALSHLNLWKELISDKDNNYYIILEDDVTLTDGCKERINKLTNEFENKDFIMLGYSMWENKRNKVKEIYDVIDKNTKIEIKPLNRNLYIGGFFSYSINKNGANKIINYIEQNGIKHPIDNLIENIIDLYIYELQPHIVHTDWNEPGKPAIDTYIQRNFETLNFNNI
jgi:GR25 family glycosyltransferase involved in LPS biosynthesis